MSVNVHLHRVRRLGSILFLHPNNLSKGMNSWSTDRQMCGPHRNGENVIYDSSTSSRNPCLLRPLLLISRVTWSLRQLRGYFRKFVPEICHVVCCCLPFNNQFLLYHGGIRHKNLRTAQTVKNTDTNHFGMILAWPYQQDSGVFLSRRQLQTLCDDIILHTYQQTYHTTISIFHAYPEPKDKT